MNDFAEDKARGLVYQVYVNLVLKEQWNFLLTFMQGRLAQQQGESEDFVEVKFQDAYRWTSNLWIETHNRNQQPSGIYKPDNTLIWICGTEEILFIFDRKVLQRMNREKPFTSEPNRWQTAYGFIVSHEQAVEYAITTIKPSPKLIRDWHRRYGQRIREARGHVQKQE